MMVEVVVLAGTPADCVSLAFTGEIFPWRKPTLVRYSLPTQHMFLKLCCSMSCQWLLIDTFFHCVYGLISS